MAILRACLRLEAEWLWNLLDAHGALIALNKGPKVEPFCLDNTERCLLIIASCVARVVGEGDRMDCERKLSAAADYTADSPIKQLIR